MFRVGAFLLTLLLLPVVAAGDFSVSSSSSISGVPLGGAGSTVPAVGVAHVNTTAVGNVGTGEDDMMTYSLPANTLSADGKGVRITAWGTYAANGNTKTAKMHFGGTSLGAENGVTASGGAWRYEAVVIRTGAATQEAMGWTISQSTVAPRTGRTTPAETLSGAVTIKMTGTGSADNDIVQRGMIVEVLN